MKSLCCLSAWLDDIILANEDEVAERLRRRPANPLCSACVGLNPILVVVLALAHFPEAFLFGEKSMPLC